MMPTTILIVDDDQGFRETVKFIVERESDLSIVGEAEDGEEAIRCAREQQPDIVTMDIVMPRVGGLEATRRIKAERPEVKIIILTVHAEQEYQRAAVESSADAFLAKKTLVTSLLPTIREVARGGPWKQKRDHRYQTLTSEG